MNRIFNNQLQDGPAFAAILFKQGPVDRNTGEKSGSSVKSIHLSGNQWIIIDEVPFVFCEGFQYYDLRNIGFLNNNGIAALIELLKSLLSEEIEVRFVNVNKTIKSKINSLGLHLILICN